MNQILSLPAKKWPKIWKELTSLNRLQIAKGVSLVLHPFLISPLAIVLVLYLDGGSLWAALGWAILCAAFVVAPAIFYIRRRLKMRQYTDADISLREQRHSLYIFGSSCVILCFIVLLWLEAPKLLIISFVAAMSSLAAFTLITRFWTKISIHAGVLAGVTTVVSFYSWALIPFLVLSTILVSWSRIVLGHHTWRQILLGWGVAIICALLVFVILQ